MDHELSETVNGSSVWDFSEISKWIMTTYIFIFLVFFIMPQSIYSSGILSCIIHLLLIIPDMSFRNSYRQHQYLFLSFCKILINFNYIRWYWKVPRQDYIHVKDLMDCSVTVFVNSFTNFPHYLAFFTSDPSWICIVLDQHFICLEMHVSLKSLFDLRNVYHLPHDVFQGFS